MTIFLKNAKIIETDNQLKLVNVFIQEKKIHAIDHQKYTADKIIDLKGKLLMPGLVDVHVHLREPGFEHKETIHTGSLSALYGGRQLNIQNHLIHLITRNQFLNYLRNYRRKTSTPLCIGIYVLRERGKVVCGTLDHTSCV